VRGSHNALTSSAPPAIATVVARASGLLQSRASIGLPSGRSQMSPRPKKRPRRRTLLPTQATETRHTSNQLGVGRRPVDQLNSMSWQQALFAALRAVEPAARRTAAICHGGSSIASRFRLSRAQRYRRRSSVGRRHSSSCGCRRIGRGCARRWLRSPRRDCSRFPVCRRPCSVSRLHASRVIGAVYGRGRWPSGRLVRDHLCRAPRTAATAIGASATPLAVPAMVSDGKCTPVWTRE
jgi:hypothetical protein